MGSDHMLGQVLGGRYTLRELVREEELGRVYHASSPEGEVSVKLLKPLDHQNPERMARLGRELMATALVAHPSAVRLLDFGAEGVFHYAVFERLDGWPLSDLLREGGPLEPARAARVGLHVARALASAHASGVVHRNLHPGNVLVGEGPDDVKVCDFGLCLLQEGEGDSRLTAQGTRLGKPEYMSPEYVAFFDVSPRGDLYALGVLLFEMLVGQPPFTGPTEQVLKLVADVEAPPPSAVRADTPPWLDHVVRGLLAKQRDRRTPTADAAAAQLERGLAGEAAPPGGVIGTTMRWIRSWSGSRD